MPDIEKNTMTVGRVATLITTTVLGLATVGGVYFAAMNGVRDGFQLRDKKDAQQDLAIQALEYKNELQNSAISEIVKSGDFSYELIKELQEALKPESPTIKTRRK